MTNYMLKISDYISIDYESIKNFIGYETRIDFVLKDHSVIKIYFRDRDEVEKAYIDIEEKISNRDMEIRNDK